MTLAAMTLFLWVELIGFDNTKADFGVDAYLARMERKPDAISLLLNSDRLFLSYKGPGMGDFVLPPANCAYRSRPFNKERKRQEWTAEQLKGLVKTLRGKDIEVYASFFYFDDMPIEDDRIQVVADKLVPFLVDFGFSGFHGSDGFAPPMHFLRQCEHKDRARIARKTAAQFAANWKCLAGALKAKGLKCYVNTCWTLDPYEALFRYGVDYRSLAASGVDGFIVESSAAAHLAHGWVKTKASPLDKSLAMLMRLKAAVPNTPLILLHGINDGAEQWSALRHATCATKSEALAMGSVFYGNRRALDGFLACLADGVEKHEWRELTRVWDLAFTPAKEPVGLRVVWSDRAFDAEFDECSRTLDCSANTFLREMLRHGAVINSSVSVEDALEDKTIPLMIINPKFFPKEELDALVDRTAQVKIVGLGAVPPNRAEYRKVPEDERFVPGMPYDDGFDFIKPLPENMPDDIFFKRAAWAGSVPFYATTEGVSCYGYKMANGRLAVFARNESDAYVNANIVMNLDISDILVHTDFPTLPPKTAIQARIAPRDTVFLSVKDHEVVPSPVAVE